MQHLSRIRQDTLHVRGHTLQCNTCQGYDKTHYTYEGIHYNATLINDTQDTLHVRGNTLQCNTCQGYDDTLHVRGYTLQCNTCQGYDKTHYT